MTSFSKPSMAGLVRLYNQVPEECLCPACGKREVEPQVFETPWDEEHPTKWAVPICDVCQVTKVTPRDPKDALEAAGLRGRLLDRYLTTFRSRSTTLKDALEAAWAYVRNPDGNLWLHGATGTGKTHLAAAIARELLCPSFGDTKPRSVLFAYVPALLDDLRSLQLDFERPSLVDSKPATVGILILDDFGAHRTTPFADEALDTIVNERWVQGKPIVVTSNLDPDEASQRVSDRMVSRIISSASVVDLGTEDYRVIERKGG